MHRSRISCRPMFGTTQRRSVTTTGRFRSRRGIPISLSGCRARVRHLGFERPKDRELDWGRTLFLGPDLPPGSAHGIIRHSNRLSGPLFLHHSESESPAVLVLVTSRLAANSQAISWGVLSP